MSTEAFISSSATYTEKWAYCERCEDNTAPCVLVTRPTNRTDPQTCVLVVLCTACSGHIPTSEFHEHQLRELAQRRGEDE